MTDIRSVVPLNATPDAGRLRSWIGALRHTDVGLAEIPPASRFHLCALPGEREDTQRYIVIFSNDRGSIEQKLFLKQYREPQRQGALEHEFRSLRLVNDALNQTQCLRAPRPYAWDEELRVLLTEYCAGRRVDTALLRPLRVYRPAPIRPAVDLIRRAALLLHELQKIPIPRHWPGASRPSEVTTRYASDLERRLRRCREIGLAESLLSRVRTFVLQHLHDYATTCPIVFQHSDFSPHNMMRWNNGLVLFDFHNAAAGLSMYDRAFFYTALAMYHFNRTLIDGRLARIRSSFLEGLQGESGTYAHHALFNALCVMHTCYFAPMMIIGERECPWWRRMCHVPPVQFIVEYLTRALASAT